MKRYLHNFSLAISKSNKRALAGSVRMSNVQCFSGIINTSSLTAEEAGTLSYPLKTSFHSNIGTQSIIKADSISEIPPNAVYK